MINFKYCANQNKDIYKYGAKFVKRFSVDENFVEKIAPYRRLSNKPPRLSDSQYFITKFEKERGKKYLPYAWESMSNDEKADYIVKDRYSNFVARRIMQKISSEEIENLYTIDSEGEIVSHDIGDKYSCKTINLVNWLKFDTKQKSIKKLFKYRTVHNHSCDKDIQEYINTKEPKLFERVGISFSGNDIYASIMQGAIGYVSDTFGHFFRFIPMQMQLDNTNISSKVEAFLNNCIRKHATALQEIKKSVKKQESLLKDFIDFGFCSTETVDGIKERITKEKLKYYLYPKTDLNAQEDNLYAIRDYGLYERLK